MHSDACQRQYRRLAAVTDGPTLPILRWTFALGAAAGLGLGIVSGRHWATVIGAFCALVAFGAWPSSAHIRRARQAYDSPQTRDGAVEVTVRQWSDDPVYTARVSCAGQPSWRFDFLPLDAPPAAGHHPARLHYLPGVAWPALVSIEAGLIFPRRQPRRDDGAASVRDPA